MNDLSQLLAYILLAPMIYGAAGKLGFVTGNAYWNDPLVILPLAGAAWLAGMGGILLASTSKALANITGFLLVLWAIGAQVSPDLMPMLALGIAIGALFMVVLNAPSGWAKANLPAALIAIACLLIGRYA